MFFRILAYRRDARSNQPARKVRQTRVLYTFSNFLQLQPIEETKEQSHDFVQRESSRETGHGGSWKTSNGRERRRRDPSGRTSDKPD